MSRSYFAEYRLSVSLGECKDMEEAVGQAFAAMEDMGDSNTRVELEVVRSPGGPRTDFQGVEKPPSNELPQED